MVGGGAIGFVPGVPDVELAPEAVLVLFLPPLLYGAAFFSSLRDLRDNARPIGLLAPGGARGVDPGCAAGCRWPPRSHAYQHLQRQVLEAQRAEIVRLRNERFINDEVMHRIERDLDLEDTRLEIPSGGAPPAG